MNNGPVYEELDLEMTRDILDLMRKVYDVQQQPIGIIQPKQPAPSNAGPRDKWGRVK